MGARRVAELDGLRGVAVALVLVGHSPAGQDVAAAKVGVTVFFVLSGYLITGVILGAAGRGEWSWRRFYLRRAARLLPALAAMLVVSGAFFAAAGWSVRGLAVEGGEALGYVANFSADLGPWMHTWSLSTEEQFYLAWPICLLALWRAGRLAWLPWLAAALLGVRLVTGAVWSGEWVNYWPQAWAGALLLGAACHVLPRPPRWAAYVGLGVLAVGSTRLAGWSQSHLAVAAAVATVPLLREPLGLLRHAALRWLGKVSYAAYLWSLPVLHAWALTGMGRWTGTLLTVTLTLGLAAASWRWVEAPVLGWSGRLLAVRPPIRAGSTRS